jgi:hypothetical protein
MAETAANEAAQSYAVIEQAYSKENWATVLQDGEELLRRLRQSDNAQLMGLQMRLQLLLGHTQLYGYANKAEAAGFYAAVAEQSSEAALTRIAKQGLKQCAIEEAPTEQAPAKAVAKAVAPTSGSLSPATPWLTVTAATALSAATAATAVTPAPIQQAESQPLEEPAASTPASPWSEPSLVPEVVEEPELIELHQSDPFLAEDVELDWKEPTPAKPSLDKADEDLISGLMLVRIR